MPVETRLPIINYEYVQQLRVLRELLNSLERVESLKPDGIAPRAFRTSARLVCVTVAFSLAQRSRLFLGAIEVPPTSVQRCVH